MLVTGNILQLVFFGDLGVWRSAAIAGGLPAWQLSATSKRNLKIALLGGGRTWNISRAWNITMVDRLKKKGLMQGSPE